MVQFRLVMQVINYFKEVRSELSKITWPKRDEIIKLTLIVLVFSGIIGVYLGGLDYLFTKILEILIAK